MNTRILFGCVLLACAIVLPGCKKDNKTDSGGGYDSPQAVWDAAKKAEKDKDGETFIKCFDADTQNILAAGMVFTGMFATSMSKFDKKAAEKMKPVQDVMNKHGLTEDFLKKAQKDKPKGNTPEDLMKAMLKLTEPIKDKAAFFVEMTKAMDAASDKKKQKDDHMIADAELKDVKIDGDKAKGKMVGKKGGEEKEQPIEFVKESGGWKIHIPAEAFGK